MNLAQFKAVVDSLCERYANARVDFVYPYKRGEKYMTRTANMTSYSVILMGGSYPPIIRIVIGDARGPTETGETP